MLHQKIDVTLTIKNLIQTRAVTIEGLFHLSSIFIRCDLLDPQIIVNSSASHKGQLLTVTALSRCGRSAEMSAISEIGIITQIRAIRATSGQHDNHLLAGILANLLSLSQRERQYQQ